MRKSSTVAALFPSVRRKILSVLLLDGGREWYMSELAARIGAPPSSLQRELVSLVAAGVVAKRRDGNRAYFRADRKCPIFLELQGIMLKTTGLADPLRKALATLAKGIELAFVFGSVAKGTESSASDVDLLIVGAVRLAEVIKALAPVERALGRPINPVVVTLDEMREGLTSRKHFLSSVVSGPKLFIIGTERDLERTVGDGRRAPS